MFDQIPEEIQDCIFYKFLYSKFLRDFKWFFECEKKFTKIKYNFYTWDDQVYRDFMIQVLIKLEPRREEKESVIFYELDDFSEILFFMKGYVDIGFELNRKRFFVLRKGAGVILADHGCTFGHTSNFIYKTHTICEGFSIRKLDWQGII